MISADMAWWAAIVGAAGVAALAPVCEFAREFRRGWRAGARDKASREVGVGAGEGAGTDSRFEYDDEATEEDMEEWFARVDDVVASADGQRGVRAVLAALEALPSQRLITGVTRWGREVCALGATIAHRAVLDGASWDEALALVPSFVDPDLAAVMVEESCGVPFAIGYTVAEINDDILADIAPEARYRRALELVREYLRPETGGEEVPA